ncbi:MAG TPA: hypothetical protein V6D08_14860 [Candidatus Obscuribacterales bacterium]
MAPYEGDRFKKEKEALNLIIKMKKGEKTSHTGEIVFFVILPVVLALCIMRYRDIQDFARGSKPISAVIKVFYPAWQEAPEPAPLPGASAERDAGQEGAPPATESTEATKPAAKESPEEIVPRGLKRGNLLK